MNALLLLSVIASLVFALCYLIILIKAFLDEILEGVLCLLIPLYIFYYALAKLKGEYRGLLLSLFFLSLFGGPALQFGSMWFAPKDDPCKLVTKADVEAAFGEPVAADMERGGGRSAAGEAKFCAYRTQALPSKEVAIGVIRNCPSLQPLRERARDMKFPFTDFGDEGYYGGSDLMVRSKNTCLAFVIEETGSAARTGIAGMSAHEKLRVNRKLAEAAINRLPQ
ncbi:MAG: hypothetical protein ACRD4U_03320 [Candidatus Acidiferrales bacterium]